MVAEGHATSGNLNKRKSVTSTTSTSLKGKAVGGNATSFPVLSDNFGLSTREKYLNLQKRLEELTAIQTKNRAILKHASSKLKSLQDECDMLIDSIAPHVPNQPSLLHFLEHTSEEGANFSMNGPGGSHAQSHTSSDASLRAGAAGGARVGSGGR